MTIGFVTFGMPPEYNRKISGSIGEGDIENILERSTNTLIKHHVRTAEELSAGLAKLRSANIGCLVVVISVWTRISLVVNLVRSMGVPAAMYARMTGGFNGTTALTAASAGLREMSGSRMATLHTRFKEGMENEVLDWIDGAAALNQMRQSRLLCWGGFYGANMPYTRSDPDWLEANLVAEVMTEQEVVLTDKADRIVAETPERADAFLQWVEKNGLHIDYESPMCTRESLRRQVALYLAARDRLAELEGENIRGVSLKCHFELSTTHWGCTGCMLPAFLPFPQGPDGLQPVVPMACEGDLNGLVSLLMLDAVNPDVPPLFGDLVDYSSDCILMRNCGSASVYWAGASNDPAESLARTDFRPNMHGASGAAVHFETPEVESVTACRLFRLDGEFRVFVATGRVVGETRTTRYADSWPHTRLDFSLDADLLFKAYPCNHSSITQGDYSSQIQWICRLAGIQCDLMSSDSDLERFLNELYSG